MTDLNATVIQRVEISPGLIVLRIQPNDWELPEFTPGQFAVIGLPGAAARDQFATTEDTPADPDKIIKRAYSIASSSAAREYLELYIAMVPSGALTPRLFALRQGDQLWLGEKFKGLFTLSDVPADQNVILISTGTGLAPYMSMLRDQLVCGGPQHFAVLHGARHSWELGYRAELRTLDRHCPNMTYIPSISRPDDEPVAWSGATGRLQEVWQNRPFDGSAGFAPTPATTHIFLCGNPSMIESMVEILSGEGYREHTRKKPGQVHVERYW